MPVSTVVYVSNATTGVNTVLRNIVWNSDGKDEILQFNIIYGACGKTTDYICEMTHDVVRTREINLTYPIEDPELLAAFKSAIQDSRNSGHRPRLAIFDTIVSNPGLRFPFEALTAICREEGILSLIDGAHGVGHIDLDLSTLDPDFFVSNCHKWLFAPRGCAVFYVPERNQDMIRSPLPTSHGFVTRSELASGHRDCPWGGKSDFVSNFEFIGTTDPSSYLTVPEAIKWRVEVCGGEDAIRAYCTALARDGGRRVAEILGTTILDNKSHSLTDCCMVNVLLPLSLDNSGGDNVVIVEDRPGAKEAVTDFILHTLIDEYSTFMPVFFFQGAWWTRLSGQIYLDMDDFEEAGRTLKEVCERVGREVK